MYLRRDNCGGLDRLLVSLKPEIKTESGSGTVDDPYIIDLDFSSKI